ncbi:hypothetical protein BD410DRAFT_843516 [Rickenella mellea]|uniref:F-box domain-containing protein n=1 Tax=Rickenella mellea TaxID=50990 RepID=A0A4Y7PQ85_9AGAM|nr:hypothetical protein BD410DRAFT_843516 [Rickenella mellea]
MGSTISESAICKSTNWQDQFQAVSVSQSSPVAHEGVKIENANEFAGIKTLKNTLHLAGQLIAFNDATVSSPIDLKDRLAKHPAYIQPRMVNDTLIDTTQSLKRKRSDELDDRRGKRRKVTLLSLPDEVFLMVAEHFEGKTRRKDLRTLTGLNRLCANLFAEDYMHEVGFRIDRGILTLRTVEAPDIFRTSDALPRTDPYSALLIWRRSHLYTKLRKLICLFSPSLDVATIESQFLLSFLKSFTAPSKQPHVESVTLKTFGMEQVMFHRILENVHRLNSIEMHLSMSADVHGGKFSRPVCAGDMPHLTRFEIEGDIMTSPCLLSWTAKVCSATTLRVLRLGGSHFTLSGRKRLMIKAVTLPSLQEIAIDATICMVDFEEFLARHRQIQKIDVVSSPRPSVPKMHVSRLNSHISLPDLEMLGGPPPFLLEMFGHLDPLPRNFHSITIRPDGGSLDATTVEKVLRRLPRDVFHLSVYFSDTRSSFYYLPSKAGRRVRPECELVNLTSVMFKRQTLRCRSDFIFDVLEREVQDQIIDWLELFPSLTTVRAIGVRDGRSFKDRLYAKCPRLDRRTTIAV